MLKSLQICSTHFYEHMSERITQIGLKT